MTGNGSHGQRLLSFWKGYRRFLAWGIAFVGVAVAGCWLWPGLWFQYRFGAVLPDGVSNKTNVNSMSWPVPPGVRKTYSRQVREHFGWYYPESQMRLSRRWWDQFPKRLDDVLAEYGARVEDDKLVDANGRSIAIMKKWRGSSRPQDWDNRRSKLVMEHRTVLVVDIEEDE
ncbi:MAG: hypothetical protein JNM56_06125 [Planctomycetia bacterium]|nr:hypothetical protein [Planctomycetia bacterium]